MANQAVCGHRDLAPDDDGDTCASDDHAKAIYPVELLTQRPSCDEHHDQRVREEEDRNGRSIDEAHSCRHQRHDRRNLKETEQQRQDCIAPAGRTPAKSIAWRFHQKKREK
ncbi:hypothetical protein LY307_08075 [Caballeronia sp. CLC5]|nr:hypothetical protein [Caballeronia sp. CLC5]MCE4568653.1 hypothetical protein [Caballeronia sp. CLC5]